MHLVTFLISSFEVVMLFFQIIYYLQRRDDRNRLWFLLLLFFLILYNVTSGLFPDPDIPIPISTQIVSAYFVGFSMSMYFSFYFYKVYQLEKLKFFALWGSLLFLFLPFILFFVVPYYVWGDVELARKLTVVIPFMYGLSFIYFISKNFYERYIKNIANADIDWISNVAVYVALLFWCSLPVIIYMGDYQVIEHSVTNLGFLLLTVAYLRSTILTSKQEYERMKEQEKKLVSLRKVSNELSKTSILLSKNEINMNKIKDIVFNIDHKEREKLGDLVKIVKESAPDGEEWSYFLQTFDNVNDGLYVYLKSNYPELSENELCHLALIKNNLQSKDIARILDVKITSLRVMRHRLKKKLEIDSDQTIEHFLSEGITIDN